jgi:hypothetical protein
MIVTCFSFAKNGWVNYELTRGAFRPLHNGFAYWSHKRAVNCIRIGPASDEPVPVIRLWGKVLYQPDYIG